ncbi:hypothetical protein ACIBK9_18410 [Nonomuraea sp. NPDC050227]|uniref:hypothetical protein n=1 Tax=Nonomuraea sp. NPDC050227 TaxID=3364360 RepID=UPI00379F7DEE
MNAARTSFEGWSSADYVDPTWAEAVLPAVWSSDRSPVVSFHEGPGRLVDDGMFHGGVLRTSDRAYLNLR